MGSASLQALTITSPGVYGLNKQNSGSLLPPQWATEALNAVFDDNNRISARKGWLAQTTSAISGTPNINVLFEYNKTSTSTKTVISAANNDIFQGITAPASVKGALTITDNNWQFANYNDKVYGLQTGHPLIEWNGTGNFAATTAASGSVPNGNALLGAFGRLWGSTSDGQTVKYSGLLDATNWGSTGSGSINLTSVWANGADRITAIAAFNSLLVVFGTNNIVLIGDGSGSSLGLDPANAYVADLISGVGCVARDSVQNINGDDLVFLSSSGLMSLRRVIEQQGNPLRDLSKNNRDYLNRQVYLNGTANIRSTFNPIEGMYLLLLPTANKIFYFNTKILLEDESWRMTEWDSFIPYSLLTGANGVTTYCGKAGKIFTYEGKQDNTAAYTWKFHTPWIAYQEQVQDTLKTLKRIGSIQNVSGQLTVTYKWFLDFRDSFSAFSKTLGAGTSGGEWNVGEFSEDEYGGQYGLVELEIPAKKAGQFIKLGVETQVSNADISLHQLQLFAKFGRLI
jgi:hypothetical protein